LLCQQGEQATKFYQIVSGKIRQFILTPHGSEVLVYLYGDGDVVGDFAAVEPLPYPVNIAAQTEVKLRVWSLKAFAPIRHEFPEIDAALAVQMAKRLRAVLIRMEEMSTLGVPARVAGRLLSIMQTAGSMELQLSQADLALSIGASRQTVNEVLNTLRRRKLIACQYGVITVLDAEGLQRFKISPPS
jgi:CRP/FNR family transcriptional regulator